MCRKLVGILLACVALCSFHSCETVNNQRIPAMPVNLELDSYGLWTTYGVHAYGSYRKFIKSDGVPGNYSYTTGSYTGFGGLLLISGYDVISGDYNTPLVYDLACPVEVERNVRVTIDPETLEAVCHKCGSRYNVCEAQGAPVSGKAVDLKYGLQKYNARISLQGGYLLSR